MGSEDRIRLDDLAVAQEIAQLTAGGRHDEAALRVAELSRQLSVWILETEAASSARACRIDASRKVLESLTGIALTTRNRDTQQLERSKSARSYLGPARKPNTYELDG